MTLEWHVDWAKNGNFTSTGDDISDYVQAGAGASFWCEYGRDQTSPLSPMTIGRGALVLKNDSRRFTPRNASSPLAGNLKPGRPLRGRRSVPDGGTFYGLFYGHGDDQPLNPDLESKTVSLGMVDNLGGFRGRKISTAVSRSIRTGTAIGLVLDAAGWTGGRDLDPGVTVIPYWWEEGTDAFDALEKIARSEGPPALLTIGADGTIVFRDRHHRITRSASTTSQATFRAGGALEPVMTKGFVADESWRNIINDATVSVDVRRVQPIQRVWEYASPISIAAGETITLVVETDNPVLEMFAPTVNVDAGGVSSPNGRYDVTPASIFTTASISRTSGQSAILSLTNTDATDPCTITNLYLTARPIAVEATVQVSSTDAASVTDYGSRGLPQDLPWCNQYDAQRILDTIVDQRAQPLTTVTCRFAVGRTSGGNTARSVARAQAVLARNLSDRVTVIEDESAINGAFFIEHIRHDSTGELDHTVTLTLEAAPAGVPPALADLFTFDVNVAGRRFNSGKFG